VIDPQEVPIPVTQSHLAMWLAFATPFSVAVLSMIQIWFNSRFGQKINEIHSYTNSTLGAALTAKAAALRALAFATKKPEDVRAADVAEAESDVHQALQKAMEKKMGIAH
jgi:hypothetical protein